MTSEYCWYPDVERGEGVRLISREQTPIQVPCANGTNVKEGGPYSLTPSWLSWYAASRPLHDDVNSEFHMFLNQVPSKSTVAAA